MFLCGWNGKIIADSSCIFHEYPNIDPAENVLELLTDADWASDKKKTRCSVSGAVLCYGGCLLFCSSNLTRLLRSLQQTRKPILAFQEFLMHSFYPSWYHGWLGNVPTLFFTLAVREHVAFCRGKVLDASFVPDSMDAEPPRNLAPSDASMDSPLTQST